MLCGLIRKGGREGKKGIILACIYVYTPPWPLLILVPHQKIWTTALSPPLLSSPPVVLFHCSMPKGSHGESHIDRHCGTKKQQSNRRSLGFQNPGTLGPKFTLNDVTVMHLEYLFGSCDHCTRWSFYLVAFLKGSNKESWPKREGGERVRRLAI